MAVSEVFTTYSTFWSWLRQVRIVESLIIGAVKIKSRWSGTSIITFWQLFQRLVRITQMGAIPRLDIDGVRQACPVLLDDWMVFILSF